jgi:serine/threonine protein kinase
MDVNIKIGKQLCGSFGKTCYEAQWIPNKEPPIILLIMNEETARHEVPFYLQLNSHAHIVHTFGLVKNDPQLTTLVQERAPHGDLQALLQSHRFEPTENVLVNIFLQIIDAMIYLTKQNIVHGDLCCRNILVFQMNSSKLEENVVKLTNFNSARFNDPSFIDNRQRSIPVRYCAPEILRNCDQSNYSELSDIYSMGVLMWQACSKGNIPYGSNMNDNDIRQCKLNGEKLSQPNGCDLQIWSVIHDCWYMEPELRYQFEAMRKLLSNIRIK